MLVRLGPLSLPDNPAHLQMGLLACALICMITALHGLSEGGARDPWHKHSQIANPHKQVKEELLLLRVSLHIPPLPPGTAQDKATEADTPMHTLWQQGLCGSLCLGFRMLLVPPMVRSIAVNCHAQAKGDQH